MPDAVIIGANLTDEDGMPVGYNPKNVYNMLRDLSEFMDAILTKAANRDNYRPDEFMNPKVAI